MSDRASETCDWSRQIEVDDPLYRAQVAYLFEDSPFYRTKLQSAGFPSADAVGGLADIDALPFTTKDELRESRTEENAIGAHLAAPMDDIVRIYSTSGTTGMPSYIPLTARDLEDWVEISSRSYTASGARRGHRLLSTYNAGPFVAGVTLDAFAAIGFTHIPVGAGNTERLMAAVRYLNPDILACTPSYAMHLAEWAEARDFDLQSSSVKRILVAGEPGGGEPALRQRIEAAWGARVTEAMGIGDVSVSLWGECEAQDGMHFSGRGFVHPELVDPDSGAQLPWEDGAEGELVYTHLRHRAAPILRFRSRDHVIVRTGACSCGRTGPRVRCIGRTDDMLIVRGVNVFPTAVREIVAEFAPDVTGVISICPPEKAVKQQPPLPIKVEVAEGGEPTERLSASIRQKLRDTLLFTSSVELVPAGSLPRTDYKSKLVHWPEAG
jgi:phenylacetate-CoA ligase